jgi:hypothetical protein
LFRDQLLIKVLYLPGSDVAFVVLFCFIGAFQHATMLPIVDDRHLGVVGYLRNTSLIARWCWLHTRHPRRGSFMTSMISYQNDWTVFCVSGTVMVFGGHCNTRCSAAPGKERRAAPRK